MNRSILLAASLFALSFAGMAAAAAPPMVGQEIADQAQVGAAVTAVGADSFAATSVAFPNGVRGMPDVTYQTLMGYRPMKLDLFLPPAKFDKMGPRPFVVYIHGGGWVGGGPRRSAAFSDWPKVLASLSEKGYVVASVSYRFAREAPSPAAIQDVKAAIRFLRANAEAYHLDRTRGMTFGQSAGGHLASMVAVSCGVAALAPEGRRVPTAAKVEFQASTAAGADEQSDCVQGAVSWFGVYDFATMPKAAPDAPPSPMDLFLGCNGHVCTDEQVRLSSPMTYVSAKTPPILVMHGSDDKQVPVAQSIAFEKALKAAGVKTDLVIFPGSDHSWICPTPEQTRAVSRSALQQSVDFIEATIGDKAK